MIRHYKFNFFFLIKTSRLSVNKLYKMLNWFINIALTQVLKRYKLMTSLFHTIVGLKKFIYKQLEYVIFADTLVFI